MTNSDSEMGMMLKTDEDRVIHGSTITFNSINYTVFSKQYVFCMKPTKKQILYNLTGIFKPGMNAILGPTASGKSSLLDILAGRKDRRGLTGQVLIDGQPSMQDFKYRVGYVVQDDMLSETLTVRENLTFSANVRLPRNISSKDKTAIVDRVIKQLGLDKCADTRIGTENSRKVSGGERKRTNIGMELVLSPTVLFLDEPTTGLDSSTANSVIECLGQLSKKGHTIIFSIHQPRYSIFKLFDNIFLIAAGHCIYHGPASDVLSFFTTTGFTCEEHDNPADFILDISQGLRWTSCVNIENEIEGEGQKKDKIARYLHDVYIKSATYTSINQQIANVSIVSNEEKPIQPRSESRSALIKMLYVSQRTLRKSFRNPTLMVMQTIVPICLAIFIGFLYCNTSRTLENGIKNRFGAIFFIVCNQVFLNLSALELFIKDRSLYIHENASGYYSTLIYFISKLLCDILPLRSIPSVLFSLIAYFMIQFQQTVTKFFIFLLTIFMTAICSASICFFISASVESFALANLITAAYCVTMLVFTGYLLDVTTTIKFLAWIKWVSIFRYASNAITVNEFTDLKLCQTNNTNICLINGEDILKDQKIDYSTTWDLWANFVALGIMIFVYFILTYVQLLRIQKAK
ncbi:unnamed protein product [Rotaria sordida]|uniref:ABC transporter domain-containing protein n=1 Tax=Rotaria sordida TaxID=392033 RepID=A0A815S222_9BILA|nr:unnamed protein product [Rotaria sordida]CAF1484979.1 unnamed protein product [Rotaria sordida]CAF3955592.1 unnamed protein product [Rotaria sordida]CAF4052983.1 unnamed protein product [Rotaria sordida]